jgi:hypothetical protein
VGSRRPLAGSIATVLVVAACGTSGPSKADFLSKADAVCTTVRQQLDVLTAPSTLPEIAIYLNRSVQINQDAVAKVRALTPPPEDRAAVSTVLGDFDTVIAKAKVAQQKAAAGDSTGADAAVKELGLAVETAGKEAKQYGFAACGQGSSSAGASASP